MTENRFTPVRTISVGDIDKYFHGYEQGAFLRQHFGYGKDQTLRWGNDVDVAHAKEQEKALQSMLACGDGRPVSYYETLDNHWLRITSHYDEAVKGIITEIEGGLIMGMAF